MERGGALYTQLPTPFLWTNKTWRRLLVCGWVEEGWRANPHLLPGPGWVATGGGTLYLVVQRAEVLEAPKAGVAQADQDGEQHDQEGKQGGRGRHTWGQWDTSLRQGGGRSCHSPSPWGGRGPHLLQELWVTAPSGR